MKPLHICQIATVDMSVGLLLADQIQMLAAMGHRVTAVCAPGANVERLRAQGMTIETVPMRRELAPAADLRSLWQLARLFRRRRFDVVHSHTPKAGLIGPLAARVAGVPLVLHTIHGLMFHDGMQLARQAPFWFAERLTSAAAHHLLSQSAEDVETACRTGLCLRRNITYLGNGIDVERFAPRPRAEGLDARAKAGLSSGDFVLGFVGRLVAEKGVLELLEMTRSLAAIHPRMKLLVVGPEEKDQSDSLSIAALKGLQTDGKVVFTGFQGDMPPWYSAMDMFVLPSHREGVPRAAMEAAAMGLPIVASDIRGCREVVLGGKTGLLCRVRDVPALSTAVDRLIRDDALRRRFGAAGAAHIRERFDRRMVHDRLRAVYEKLAGGGIRGRAGAPRALAAPEVKRV